MLRGCWFSLYGPQDGQILVVWSAHVELGPDAEPELTLAGESWASVDPIDPGTLHVVADPFTILIDKDRVLRRLCSARL